MCVWIYVDMCVCLVNDGIVFTPSTPSYLKLFEVHGPHPPLLKWKPLEDNTVDFVVKETDLHEACTSSAPADISMHTCGCGMGLRVWVHTNPNTHTPRPGGSHIYRPETDRVRQHLHCSGQSCMRVC